MNVSLCSFYETYSVLTLIIIVYVAFIIYYISDIFVQFSFFFLKEVRLFRGTDILVGLSFKLLDVVL